MYYALIFTFRRHHYNHLSILLHYITNKLYNGKGHSSSLLIFLINYMEYVVSFEYLILYFQSRTFYFLSSVFNVNSKLIDKILKKKIERGKDFEIVCDLSKCCYIFQIMFPLLLIKIYRSSCLRFRLQKDNLRTRFKDLDEFLEIFKLVTPMPILFLHRANGTFEKLYASIFF